MQNKITLRHQLIPVKMPVIKNSNTVLEMMWRQRNLYLLLVGVQINAAILEINLDIPQILKLELPYNPAIFFWACT